MPHPRLDDDGRAVTLDLHGATLAEAERLLRKTASLAAGRGRTLLRVVHGHSTTDGAAETRTIKRLVHALLDEGALAPHVTGAVRAEGHALLGLALGGRYDPRRLRLADAR